MNGGKSISLSVTELVEFSARGGNLFDHSDGPTHLEGIRGHQKVQRSRDSRWRREVHLKRQIQYQEFALTLQGRLDLLCEDILHPSVEEIKTTYGPPDRLSDAKKNLHRAQAKVYAFLLCLDNSAITAVDVRITWFDLHSGEQHTQSDIVSRASLIDFGEGLLQRFFSWYREYSALQDRTIDTAAAQPFPFAEFRPGQHRFAALVYRAIRDHHPLLIEAPTGTGKTMSTLFPAIKSLGAGFSRQIIYLTLKGSAREPAQAAIAKMIAQGLTISYITIRARATTCPCRAPQNAGLCQNAEGMCTRAVGFFDRLPKARLACLKARHLGGEALAAIADEFHLCPFALSLHMAPWCSVVICDANYMFDPVVRLKQFGEHCRQRVLLIDEIHNLPDRARLMYSAEISLRAAQSAVIRLAKRGAAVKKAAQSFCTALQTLAPSSANFPQLPAGLGEEVEKLLALLASEGDNEAAGGPRADDELARWRQSLHRFALIAELFSPSYVCLYRKDAGDSRLTLFCRDAAEFLQRLQISARSTIGFSATLSPLGYFRESVGMAAETPAYSLPPIFPPENQLTLRCDYIDTRWRQRQASLPHLSALIAAVFHARAGKYLVYLPSYDYLAAVREDFTTHYPGIDTVAQSRNSDEAERRAFLDRFVSRPGSVVGFAILGGIFGEGVDFVGEFLTGALVVGLGMPQPGVEQQLMADYVQRRGANSFQHVFQFPGMVRVRQTAGRVIRSARDKGVVILVDPRLRRSDYHSLLPAYWDVKACKNIADLNRHLARFWHRHEHAGTHRIPRAISHPHG